MAADMASSLAGDRPSAAGTARVQFDGAAWTAMGAIRREGGGEQQAFHEELRRTVRPRPDRRRRVVLDACNIRPRIPQRLAAQPRELAGRDAIGPPELAVQVALVAEPRRQGDLADRGAAAHKQVGGGAFQPTRAQAFARRGAQPSAVGAGQMHRMHAGRLGQVGHGQRAGRSCRPAGSRRWPATAGDDSPSRTGVIASPASSRPRLSRVTRRRRRG